MTEENVFEFDLNNFFPSVNLTEIEKILITELKVPTRIAGYLTAMNRSITILKKVDELDESKERKVLLTPSGKANPNLDISMKQKVDRIIKSDYNKSELEAILP